MTDILKTLEAPANPAVPQLRPGDQVNVYIRIKEGANERTQEFKGTVISERGHGNDSSFTVRRVASNGSRRRAHLPLPLSPRTRKSPFCAPPLCAAPNCTSCASALARTPA